MMLTRLAPALTLIGAVLAWQAACVVFSIPGFVLPKPTEIVSAAYEVPFVTWMVNVGATLQIVLAGFCISFAVAIPLAMLLVNSRLLSNTVVPLLVVIQSTPIVAIAPILVVSLGAGVLPRVVITCLITFFPLVIATATGLRSAPAELIELSESLKAPRFRQYTQIRLPYAIPHVLGAAKVAVTLAVIGAVVAEFVAADKGLGYMILNYTAVFKLGRAFCALLILLCISLTLYQIVALVERMFFSWSLSGGR